MRWRRSSPPTVPPTGWRPSPPGAVTNHTRRGALSPRRRAPSHRRRNGTRRSPPTPPVRSSPPPSASTPRRWHRSPAPPTDPTPTPRRCRRCCGRRPAATSSSSSSPSASTPRRARRHTVDHVRADGPLPARARRTAALRRAAGHVARPLAVRRRRRSTWLRALRQRWRALTPRVPRLDRRPGTARPPSESEVLAVLQRWPVVVRLRRPRPARSRRLRTARRAHPRRAADPGDPARGQPAGAAHVPRRDRPAAPADDRARCRLRRAARRQRRRRPATPR